MKDDKQRAAIRRMLHERFDGDATIEASPNVIRFPERDEPQTDAEKFQSALLRQGIREHLHRVFDEKPH